MRAQQRPPGTCKRKQQKPPVPDKLYISSPESSGSGEELPGWQHVPKVPKASKQQSLTTTMPAFPGGSMARKRKQQESTVGAEAVVDAEAHVTKEAQQKKLRRDRRENEKYLLTEVWKHPVDSKALLGHEHALNNQEIQDLAMMAVATA